MHSRQHGMTLVVSLIMLVVITLLVVSAIRFGIINLQIAGNMQSRTEATSAASVAVEQVFQQVIDPDAKIETIAAQNITVNTGGASYTIKVAKPACIFSKPILNSELNPSVATDKPCFEGADADKIVTSDNKLTSAPSACNDQQWDVVGRIATGDAGNSAGVDTTVVQGVALRVSAATQCP